MVVVVGTPYLYYLLNIYDPEFQKIFKISDFDTDMPRTQESEMQVARFIAGFVEHEGKLNFTVRQWGRSLNGRPVVEIKTRSVHSLTRSQKFLAEATAWARMEAKKRVGLTHVIKAIDEKTFLQPS